MLIFWLYIDPGSGSLLFQLLISGVVGLLAFFKIYWKKIKNFFVKEKKDEK